jgi:hypothetical protein
MFLHLSGQAIIVPGCKGLKSGIGKLGNLALDWAILIIG